MQPNDIAFRVALLCIGVAVAYYLFSNRNKFKESITRWEESMEKIKKPATQTAEELQQPLLQEQFEYIPTSYSPLGVGSGIKFGFGFGIGLFFSTIFLIVVTAFFFGALIQSQLRNQVSQPINIEYVPGRGFVPRM